MVHDLSNERCVTRSKEERISKAKQEKGDRYGYALVIFLVLQTVRRHLWLLHAVDDQLLAKWCDRFEQLMDYLDSYFPCYTPGISAQFLTYFKMVVTVASS